MPYASVLVRTVIGIALIACTPRAEAADGPACAARTEVVHKLAERFGETLRSYGLDGSESLVEVYVSERTGTWTILKTRPDGTSCLLAAGRLWEREAAPVEVLGDPA
jgi:hypothetical protein